MATIAELTAELTTHKERRAAAEARLVVAAGDRLQMLAGHNAAVLLRQLNTAGNLRTLAPALDALAAVPAALAQAAQRLTDARVAVLGAAIVTEGRDQRPALTEALAPLELLQVVRAAVLVLAADDKQRAALTEALVPLKAVAAVAGAVMSLAIVEPPTDQRPALLGALADLDQVATALEQSAAAVTAADNGWRRIPEPDRLALVADNA